MYTIEIYNEYRHDGYYYADDFCPMFYWTMRNEDYKNIGETDWAYGFMTISQACEVARRYTSGSFAVMIEGETHFFDAVGG